MFQFELSCLTDVFLLSLILKKITSNEYNIKFKRMIGSDLNQEKIEGFFCSSSIDEQSIVRKDDVSLNFTVTSRDSRNTYHKNKQNMPSYIKFNSSSNPEQGINIALNQLNKFKAWQSGITDKYRKFSDVLNKAIASADTISDKPVGQSFFTDLQLLKKQILHNKNNSDSIKSSQNCINCSKYEQKFQLQQKQYQEKIEVLQNSYENRILSLAEELQQANMKEVKEQLLTGVQMNILRQENQEIKEKNRNLTNQIDKFNLERSTLFCKTKTLEEKLKIQMQKSKGMSATKNSYSGLDSLQHTPSLFFDPNEIDFEEWINIFTQHCQNQKSKHKVMKYLQVVKAGSKVDKEEYKILKIQPEVIVFQKFQVIVRQLNEIKEVKIKHGLQISKSPLKQHRNSLIFQNLKEHSNKNHENHDIVREIKQLRKYNQCLENENKNLKASIQDIQKMLRSDKHVRTQSIIQKNTTKNNEVLKKLEQQKYLNQQLYEKIQTQQKKIKSLEKSLQQVCSQKQVLQIQFKDMEYKLYREKTQRKKCPLECQNLKGNARLYSNLRK